MITLIEFPYSQVVAHPNFPLLLDLCQRSPETEALILHHAKMLYKIGGPWGFMFTRFVYIEDPRIMNTPELPPRARVTTEYPVSLAILPVRLDFCPTRIFQFNDQWNCIHFFYSRTCS
jgi:hypothetical protein